MDFDQFEAWRRLWSDMAVATANWFEAHHGPPTAGTPVFRGQRADGFIRSTLPRRIQREGLSPLRPFQTLKEGPFLEDRIAPEIRSHDDRGRSTVLTWAFHLAGGVAPFLILWLAMPAALIAVAWSAAELCAAGHARAALVYAALVGLNPYVVQTLALIRYPVGFHLAAVLLLVPVSVYATLHPAPSRAGLFGRLLVAAALFAFCVFGRSSAALLAPGFVLAAWFGAARVLGTRTRRLAAVLTATALFAAPLPLVGESQQDDFWQPIWEGLGDFDRTYGFTWADDAARRAARRAGAPGLFTAESEAVFRAQVIEAIRDDPAWFGGILARRAASTVVLWKLWPWKPIDGSAIWRRDSANEGVMDKYWTYTTTFDHVGFGARWLEFPLPLLLAPTLLLARLAGAAGARSAPARAALRTLAGPALGCLVLPVAITTAGGSEAQAIGVVYLLATGLLVEVATRREVSR